MGRILGSLHLGRRVLATEVSSDGKWEKDGKPLGRFAITRAESKKHGVSAMAIITGRYCTFLSQRLPQHVKPSFKFVKGGVL